MCRTLHYFWGHQVHFWSRDCALTIFLLKSANIFETIPIRHIVTIIHRCKINTETFTLVIHPGFCQAPKPFEFGTDQTTVIRLISLMSKLLKLPIS